jgi:four helix bundle protein
VIWSFDLRIGRSFLIEKLPDTPRGRVIAFPLAKCAPSVGANYRASCNARSRAEFIARLGVVVEEAEESEYWFPSSIRRPSNCVRSSPDLQAPPAQTISRAAGVREMRR